CGGACLGCDQTRHESIRPRCLRGEKPHKVATLEPRDAKPSHCHNWVRTPFPSRQCGVQARATSFTVMLALVGLRETLSSFSLRGSVAAARASASVLNWVSRSANWCCKAETFSSACPTSPD